jgi:hypothetical protein
MDQTSRANALSHAAKTRNEGENIHSQRLSLFPLIPFVLYIHYSHSFHSHFISLTVLIEGEC